MANRSHIFLLQKAAPAGLARRVQDVLAPLGRALATAFSLTSACLPHPCQPSSSSWVPCSKTLPDVRQYGRSSPQSPQSKQSHQWGLAGSKCLTGLLPGTRYSGYLAVKPTGLGTLVLRLVCMLSHVLEVVPSAAGKLEGQGLQEFNCGRSYGESLGFRWHLLNCDIQSPRDGGISWRTLTNPNLR